MALNNTDGLSTFDQVTNKKLDLSPVLTAILLNDTSTLGLIGEGPSVMRSEFKFGSDELNPPSVTLTADCSAGAATMTVADTSKVRKGALLQSESNGEYEIMQVTAINSATEFAIDRGYGGTTDEDHDIADGTSIAVIGEPVQEGDETVGDISRDRTQDVNYTQIFKKTIKVTGTQEAEAQNGVHPGVPSELKLQIARRAMELAVQYNRAVLNSYANTTAPVGGNGTPAEYRTMKGLHQWLTEGGADSNHTNTVAAISDTVVNALYKTAWDKGGSPTALIGNAEQLNKFSRSAFSTPNSVNFRIAPSDRLLGIFVQKFLTEFGVELNLTLDRWARKDTVYLIDPSRCSTTTLNGRAMFTEPLARIGDTLRWQMVMETSTIVQNKNEAHAIHTNLT